MAQPSKTAAGWYALVASLAFGACVNMTQTRYIVPDGVEHPWEPATEQEVCEVERKLGARFPEDYREFLKSINGIQGSHNLVIPHEEDGMLNPWNVQGLFSISRDAPKINRFQESQKSYQFDRRVPKKYVIIGWTQGMCQICMSLSGNDRGTVYDWDPYIEGRDDPKEEHTTKYLTPLAGSFREFWSKLRMTSDDE